MSVAFGLQADNFTVSDKYKASIVPEETVGVQKDDYGIMNMLGDAFTAFNTATNAYNLVSDTYSSSASSKPMNINSKRAIELGKQYGLYDKKTWARDFSGATSERTLIASLENKKRANEALANLTNRPDGLGEKALALGSMAVATILDPTILLPSGALPKAAEGVNAINKFYRTKNALSIGATAAIQGGTTNYIVQRMQSKEDTNELLAATAMSGVLGMGIGGYIGNKILKQASKNEELGKIVANEEGLDEVVRQDMIKSLRENGTILPTEGKEPSSFTASDGTVVPNTRETDILSAYNSHKFEPLNRVLNFISVAPITAAMNSKSPTIQNLAYKLFRVTNTPKGTIDYKAFETFTNPKIKEYESEIALIDKKLIEPNAPIEALTKAKEDYKQVINGIRAEEFEKRTQKVGDYLVQGKTASEAKLENYTLLDNLVRTLQKNFNEFKKGDASGITHREWGDKIANDYNRYIDKLKEVVHREYKTLVDNYDEMAKIYKLETGMDIALTRARPDDLTSVVKEHLAKKYESNADISSLLTNEGQAIKEYYTAFATKGKTARAKGLTNITPSLYMNRMYDTLKIRNTDEATFIQDFSKGIINSVEFKLAKEDKLEELLATGMYKAEAELIVDTKLKQQAAVMAKQFRDKLLQKAYFDEVDDAPSLLLGNIKHRTIPLSEIDVSQYLVNNALDRLHYYSYKYSGRVALAETLGVSSTKELSDLIVSQGLGGATPKDINRITTMVKDILDVKTLNMYQAEGVTTFFNEIKKFNFATMMEDAWLNATMLEAANVYRVVGSSLFDSRAFGIAKTALVDVYRAKFPNHIQGKVDEQEAKFLDTLLLSGHFMSMDMRAMNDMMQSASSAGDRGFTAYTSSMTEFLSHAYGMKPGTYAMQIVSRSTFLVDLMKMTTTNLLEQDLKKLARYGLTPRDVDRFTSKMGTKDMKGLIENFNFDNFTGNDAKLLDKILVASRRAGEDMVLHYDASVMPEFVTKMDDGLVGLAMQFLKFGFAANEKLLVSSLDDMNKRTIGALVMGTGVAMMNTAGFESLKIELGLKDADKAYYHNKDGSLNAVHFGMNTVGYIGQAGIYPTIAEKVWKAGEDISKGDYGDAVLDTMFGITHSTGENAGKVATATAKVTRDYILGEKVADKDVENIQKYFNKLLPFEGHIVTDIAKLTVKALDSEHSLTDVAIDKAYEQPIYDDTYIEKNQGQTDYTDILKQIGVDNNE